MLTDGRSRGRAARWCDRVATAEGRLAPHACAARDAVPRARRAMRGAVGACWPSSDGPSSGVQSASGRAHGSYPAVLATVDHRAGAGAGLDLDDRGRGWGWGRWRWNAPRSATVGFWVARVGGGAERRAPRTWQKPASCLVALQRGGVPRGGPGLVTSFHRPHTCSLRRFELSRSEARAAKAHVQMRARQEASRGTPWDSSPPTAGGRPETVGGRVGEAGFGGWLPGSAATRDDAPGGGVFGAGVARGRQAGDGEVPLPVGLRLGGRLRRPASEGSCVEVGAWRSVSEFSYPRRPGPMQPPQRAGLAKLLSGFHRLRRSPCRVRRTAAR